MSPKFEFKKEKKEYLQLVLLILCTATKQE